MNRTTRNQKVKRTGTTIALTAAVALGGIALAAPADAADLGRVPVYSTPAQYTWNGVWSSGWGKAYDLCSARFSKTRSVELVTYTHFNDTNQVYSIWKCRDNK